MDFDPTIRYYWIQYSPATLRYYPTFDAFMQALEAADPASVVRYWQDSPAFVEQAARRAMEDLAALKPRRITEEP
jgi:hypothetical protein